MPTISATATWDRTGTRRCARRISISWRRRECDSRPTYSPSPLCSPSRASLLTGRIHYRTGIETWIPPETDTQLGPAEITIAKLLKGAGYQTAMTGNWHLNGGLDIAARAQPDDHGFDHWLGLHGWPVPHNRNPRNFFRNGEALGEIEGYTGQIVVDEAISWLGARDEGRPFFLYVPLIEPHSTIANPDEYNAMYAEYTRGEPDPFENGLPEPPANVDARGPGEYWANITYMDQQIRTPAGRTRPPRRRRRDLRLLRFRQRRGYH